MQKFYIRQKILSFVDKYNVYNEKMELMYFAKSDFFTLAAKLHLYRAGLDQEIYLIKKRLFTFLPKYDLYKDNKIVATIKKKFTFLIQALHIESEYGNFDIIGDFLNHNYSISKNNQEVCKLKKVWLTIGDSYEILIEDDENIDFYIALVILIDNCLHNGSSTNSKGSNASRR